MLRRGIEGKRLFIRKIEEGTGFRREDRECACFFRRREEVIKVLGCCKDDYEQCTGETLENI